MILTWLILILVIGAVASWAAGRRSAAAARWTALIACAVDFIIAVALWVRYPTALPGAVVLEQRAEWLPRFGVSYHLALDGLGLLLVVLTTFLGVVAVAASWHEIQERVASFHLALLLLLAGIVGVFLAFDLFLFYFFWELMLIPMYFLIALWGHENRRYAAIKFFLFTFISGLLMLAAIIGLYLTHAAATGVYTFDYADLLTTASLRGPSLWLMLGFFVAFAVKLPAFPLHTWLPDAHTEAPTAGSVILAGLMLKTGAYGLLRFTIPLFPEASQSWAVTAMALGAAGVIYGGALAFAQRDMKRMVAYTSVSHLGFVLLGVYAGTEIALQGAVMVIIAHGLSTGALFLIVGMIQERTHTRDLQRLGGLWPLMPKLGGFTILFALGALGLPGLANFVGEFLVLLGVFQVSPLLSVLGSLGLVLSVIYALRLVQLSFLGPNEHNWSVPDLSRREVAILASLAVALVWLGLYPRPVFTTAAPSLPAVGGALATGTAPPAPLFRGEWGRDVPNAPAGGEGLPGIAPPVPRPGGQLPPPARDTSGPAANPKSEVRNPKSARGGGVR